MNENDNRFKLRIFDLNLRVNISYNCKMLDDIIHFLFICDYVFDIVTELLQDKHCIDNFEADLSIFHI